jgi:outer membrane protein assembly factor BamB
MTGAEKWSFPYFSNPNGGALSTAGGLVFAGESDGNFVALDARTGKDLWNVQLGAAIYSTGWTVNSTWLFPQDPHCSRLLSVSLSRAGSVDPFPSFCIPRMIRIRISE